MGRALVYLSLVFSVASAIDYVRLFGAAVEAKEEKRKKRRREAAEGLAVGPDESHDSSSVLPDEPS